MDDVNDRTLGGDIEVWNEFTGRWTRGFAIAEVVDRGYRLQRTSDGAVLPVVDATRVRGGTAPARVLPSAG